MNNNINNSNNAIDEEVWDTISRDMLVIVQKVRYVIFPFSFEEKINVLKDWELFGPLLISLAFSILMAPRVNNMESFFTILYLVLGGGAFLVTINARLLGGEGSIFLYISVLGYCMAPFIGAAAVGLSFGMVNKLFTFIASGVAYLWACKSAALFITATIDKNKKIQALIPVFLFYLYFAWFVILE